VARDEPHVSVGGLLVESRSGKKDDRGEIKCPEAEVTVGGKHNMRASRKGAQGKRQL
jgi:hypothetical protein